MTDFSKQHLNNEKQNLRFETKNSLNLSFEFEEFAPSELMNGLVLSFFDHFNNAYPLSEKLTLTNAGKFTLEFTENQIQISGPIKLQYKLNRKLYWTGVLKVLFIINVSSSLTANLPKIQFSHREWKVKPRIVSNHRYIPVAWISNLMLSFSNRTIEKRINQQFKQTFKLEVILSELMEQINSLINTSKSFLDAPTSKLDKIAFGIFQNANKSILRIFSQIQIDQKEKTTLSPDFSEIENSLDSENELSNTALKATIPWTLLRDITKNSGYQFSVDVPLLKSQIKPADIYFEHEKLVLVMEVSGQIKSKVEVMVRPEIKNQTLNLILIDFKMHSKSALQKALVALTKGQIKKIIQQAIDKNTSNLHKRLGDNLPDLLTVIKEVWGVGTKIDFSPFLYHKFDLKLYGVDIELMARYEFRFYLESMECLLTVLKHLLIKKISAADH